jgi:primosomal protein N' (replication factor Y)
MRASGVGTERVQAELEGIVDVPVIRMDADTTAVKGSHKRLLDEFSQTPGSSILLGTQMIAKGLDFEDVTLVGVINADVQLNLPDFRANERTFALISQVSGRAGRSQKPGRVIIQTQAVDAPAIKYAALYNRKEFLNNELRRRQALKLPPYTKMSNVIVSGRDWRAVEQVANAAYSLLSEIKSKRGLASALETPSNMTEAAMFEIFPPCECVVSQKSNNYRMHVLMKASLNLDMSDMLREFKFKLKPFSGVSVAIDVDPFDLL